MTKPNILKILEEQRLDAIRNLESTAQSIKHIISFLEHDTHHGHDSLYYDNRERLQEYYDELREVENRIKGYKSMQYNGTRREEVQNV